MLDRIVELVGKARAKGVLIVHITEGYTSDFRCSSTPLIPAFFTAGRSAAAPGRSNTRKPHITSHSSPHPQIAICFFRRAAKPAALAAPG